MGACSFQNVGRGKTMSEAYSDLCEDAREEYGHQDGYNGTISTTSGFRDVTSDFKRSGKSLQNFIDDNIDRAEKWGSFLAIFIEEPKGNTNKVKSQVKNIVTPGTKKWVLKYVVTDSSGRTIASKTTKGDAVKVAREHTEKTQARTYIDMVKVLEKGSTKVAEIEYKKSTTEKQGKFVFFGWAAE
jgi:hypothetical protein